MKKVIFGIFCCGMILTGCRSNTLENNLSQIRIARATELEQGKTKSERAKEIKQNILQLEEIQQAAVIIEGKRRFTKRCCSFEIRGRYIGKRGR